MIDPAVLKGFRDSLPGDEIPKKRITRILEDVFTSYGFVPIDTPVLEYTEVLLGKGGGETDKQIFRFHDNGGRDVAMRFDLTVPFARFMAAHHDEVGVPFRRYHISKVWRGENPQKGRYREFMQCDFDIVGADNAISDTEILSVMHASFAALGISRYTFHISHRGLFSLFLETLSLADRSIDILGPVTVEETYEIVDGKIEVGGIGYKDILKAAIDLYPEADQVINIITDYETVEYTIDAENSGAEFPEGETTVTFEVASYTGIAININ